MKTTVVALACVGLVGACEATSSKPTTEAAATAGHPTTGEPPGATGGAGSQASADVQAAMTEFLGYSDSVFAILREHGEDCDVAAQHLAERAVVFAKLGPRMMKVKETLATLPDAERERLEQESERAMEAFKARNPDVEALERTAKACEQTSVAFADIAPRVMFTKKESAATPAEAARCQRDDDCTLTTYQVGCCTQACESYAVDKRELAAWRAKEDCSSQRGEQCPPPAPCPPPTHAAVAARCEAGQCVTVREPLPK